MVKLNSKKLLIVILTTLCVLAITTISSYAVDSSPVQLPSGGSDTDSESGTGGGEITIGTTTITLNKLTLSLEEGKTETLTATVTPANATTVTWNSSNPNVATVDSTGKITAIKAGTATITATTVSGNKTATCTVTVTAKINPVSTNTANVEKLGQYGENDIYIVGALIVICTVSAIYAYKKIRQY